ncbi:MAG: TIGR02588 family protein [Cyanophyceae cyanobacterium]
MTKGDHPSKTHHSLAKRRSFAEWVSFGVAVVILSVIVGLVSYIWLFQDHQPPILQVSSSEVRQASGQYYVPFSVTNTGGETAESVQIVAELAVNGVIETGEQQIDFLSRNESEEGAFIFSRDPRQGNLTIRVASYRLP